MYVRAIYILRGILKGFRTLLASLGGGDDDDDDGGGGFLVYLVDLPSAAPHPPSPKSPKTSRNTMRDVTLAFEKGGREGKSCLRESASSDHQADVLANCLCFYHAGIFLWPTSDMGMYVRAERAGRDFRLGRSHGGVSF